MGETSLAHVFCSTPFWAHLAFDFDAVSSHAFATPWWLLVAESVINPHNGDTNAHIRCHLGIKIPAQLPTTGFTVRMLWLCSQGEGQLSLFACSASAGLAALDATFASAHACAFGNCNPPPTHTHTLTLTHTHTRMCTHTHSHSHTHACAHTHTHTHTLTHTHTHSLSLSLCTRPYSLEP